jgi:hypothetical protein
MARGLDVEQWRNELVRAYKYGEEAHARVLVMRPGPRKIRALLESMLEDPDALVRQAAAFGLGQLGGAASVRRLEQQLALEETRGDYDGASVVEAITHALGRLDEAGSRAPLVRRLRRLAPGKSVLSEVNPLARALWRYRHPELLPVVREALEKLALPALNSLHGLLLLLEKSPEEFRTWAQDISVPVEHKTEVLTVLEEEVPDAWVPSLPAFISVAQALIDTAVRQDGETAYYCERLLSFFLSHKERLLPVLPQEARSELRAVARRLLAATSLNCSVRAAVLLGHVGTPEDAELIKAHRPTEPVLAKVFDDAAQVLRSRQKK